MNSIKGHFGKKNPRFGHRLLKNQRRKQKNRLAHILPYSKVKKTVGMIVSLEDFQFSSFERKCDIVTGYSNYVMMRRLEGTKIYLYAIEGFFIEVYYSPKYKKVLMINAFDDKQGLEPYLAEISLSDLEK